MSNFVPPLPKGTKPLGHQVAGHKHGEGKTKLGFLECSDGSLLKPVQSPPRGLRELLFYQKVFDDSCNDPVLLKLRSFIPRYMGTFYSEDAPGIGNPRVTYFRLRDVTKSFRKPCIADIKIGPITYDPEATADKIAREKAKYPPLTTVGYQILGMRVYQLDSHEFGQYDKIYGRSLPASDVIDKGLRKFFDAGNLFRFDALSAIVLRLNHLQEWFLEQRSLAFYACSLLLVYEGDLASGNRELTLHMQPSNGYCHSPSGHSKSNLDKNSSEICDVRMIDFAHVFDTNDLDHNFLAGLNNLLRDLEKLQKQMSNS